MSSVFLNYFYNEVAWQEKECCFELQKPLPGALKEDINVQVVDDILSVSYQGNEFTDKLDLQFKLPSGATHKDVSAKMNDGVLSLKVKKQKTHSSKIRVE